MHSSFAPSESSLRRGGLASGSYSQRTSIANVTATPASVPPTQLRPLPGYTSSFAATPASGRPEPTFQAPLPPPTASTSTRYQTRERLYYELEPENRTRTEEEKPVTTASQIADDAPPALSLADISFTPDKKYRIDPNEMDSNRPFAVPAATTLHQPILEPGEGNWVTVFGFTPSQADEVVAHFKRFGAVEDVEMGQGNWAHVKYATQWAAQKALAKTGLVLPLAGSCMIGVIPTNRAIEQVSQAAQSFMSPVKQEKIKTIKTEVGTEVADIFLRPGLISPPPLAPTVRRSAFGDEPTGILQEPPIPPESVLTKALGYVFGWNSNAQ